jgi:hypothetical protein
MTYYKKLIKITEEYIECLEQINSIKANRPIPPIIPSVFNNENELETYSQKIKKVEDYDESTHETLSELDNKNISLYSQLQKTIMYHNIWHKIETQKGIYYIRLLELTDRIGYTIQVLSEIEFNSKHSNTYEDDTDKELINTSEENWHFYTSETGDEKYDYIVEDAHGVHKLYCHNTKSAIYLVEVLNKCTIPEY